MKTLVTLATCLILSASAAPKKWVFAMNRLAEDAELTYVSNVVRNAHLAGYNGLCLLSGDGYTAWSKGSDRNEPTADYIGNAAGLESWDKWDVTRKARFNALRAYCDTLGMDIIPLLWSPGYFSMRFENPSWVAVFPVKDVPFEVKGSRAISADRAVDFTLKTKGEWKGGLLKLDIDHIHTLGNPANASAEMHLKVKPYTRYRISLKWKTEGFTGTNYEPSWPTISFYVKDGVCSGGCGRCRMARDQDWTPHSREINTLHHDELTIALGSATARAGGVVYAKDIVVEECAISQPVKRAGCDFVVKDAVTGRLYKEGVDYTDVPYMQALSWAQNQPALSFAICAGSAIKEGTRLLVSAYEPPRAMTRQFSLCPSVPGLKDFMVKAADNVVAATGSKTWLLSLDEIRNECQCTLCTKRATDVAHKMGAHITEAVETFLSRYPDLTLYAWCDMLNPYDNPRQKHYYNILTSWQGIWDLVPGPDKLRVAFWGSKPKADEVAFYAQRGYRGIACGYYDYDPELKDPALWAASMTAYPETFDGWMYTTWEQKHEQMAPYAQILDKAWRVPKPEKWVFWGGHVQTPTEVNAFTNMIARAKRLGFTKVVLGGGLDYYSCWPDKSKRAFAEAANFLRAQNMGVCAAVWSLGYGAMLNYGIEYVEGAPVEGLTYQVTASGTNAVCVVPASEQPAVPNGGFEQYTAHGGFPGFAFIDGMRGKDAYTVQDNAIVHSGKAALRCTLGKGQTRVSFALTPKRNRHYKFSVWLKWQGFNAKRKPLQLLVQRDDGVPGKIGILTKDAVRKDASDWVKVETEFNSLEFSKLRLWVGVWDNQQTGTFWVDDFAVEECAPRCVLHNYGSPILVQNKKTGRLYTEGRDFTFPAMTYAQLRNANPPYPPVEMTILNTKSIKRGDALRVSFYTPSNSGSGSDTQFSICPSNPALYPMLAASARELHTLLQPEAWLLSFDEWRNGNCCAACAARKTTLPALIAECSARCQAIIRELNPRAQVSVWSDMFCPWENARPSYYAVRGRCDNGLDYLPASVGLACWGEPRHANESMTRFVHAGHTVWAAAYYDESAAFKGTRYWLQALKNQQQSSAICYTTWRADYTNLEAWSAFVDTFCAENW